MENTNNSFSESKATKITILPSSLFNQPRVVQRQATHQVDSLAEITESKHSFCAHINEKTSVDLGKGKGTMLEAVPALEDGEEHGHWYQTDLQKLQQILALARPKEQSKDITLSDLKRVIYACQREGWGVTSDATKRAKTAARILSYIAGHRWELPREAIDALKMEIKNPNPKTLHYALLALSFVVINGQSLENPKVIVSLIGRGIAQLKELLKKGRKEHLYIIVCGLAALTILNEDLANDDLDILYKVLAEALVVSSSFYHPSPDLSPV